MTARPDHHEPLDDQERELAARLARTGPSDGPSPAIDARILAAAHAAAGRGHRPRRARFAWIGVPPALITGVGVAAAAVLALGLVWQLRPPSGVPAVYGEGAGAEEEVFIVVESQGASRAPPANPPPYPAETAPAPAHATARTRAARAAGAEADAARRERAEAQAAAEAREAFAATESERSAAMTAQADAEAGFVPAAPPPPAAPAASPAPAPAPPPAASRATYTTAARASAERRERAAVPARKGSAAPAPAAVAESEAPVLDQVEVTGARIATDRSETVALAQVPVGADKRLAPAEWLQRIRERRDGGDLEAARESLRLFRREHPRVRLPDDLRALLSAAPPAGDGP